MKKNLDFNIPVPLLFNGAQKSGQSWRMLCPFHEESTPSFVIYENDQRYYCFGCGEKGSFIDYVIKRGWASNFKEALNFLRKRAGLEGVDYSPIPKNTLKINEKASRYFSECLKNNKDAIEYLKERGIDNNDIEKFRLGYANGDSKLASIGTEDELELAGIVVNKKPLFRNRIILPIFCGDNILGFAGRSVGDVLPKYINSPETRTFKKGSLLYGLFPQSVKSWGYMILVEGYFDVIAMHRAGFTNTAAAMGTALTVNHIKTIKKHTSSAVVLFDNDKTGRESAHKAANLLIENGIETKIAILPESEDPDSFIRKGGNIAQIIDAAESAAVYLLRNTAAEDKLPLLTKIARHNVITVDLLSHIKDSDWPVLQELTARRLINTAKFKSSAKVLYRMGKVEIRQWSNLLLVYYQGNFLFWQKVQGTPCKQAEKIARVVRTT